MPLDEVPTFLKALETYDGDQRTRLALRPMVLTFARTSFFAGYPHFILRNCEKFPVFIAERS
jgi:small neutral amino acid transporter SnatA (MarC family)